MDSLINTGLESAFKTQPSDYLSEYRSDAWETFQKVGFPTRRDEEYKFTPLDRLLKKGMNFSEATILSGDLKKEAAKDHFYKIDGHHLVFVQGSFRADLSELSEKEIEIQSFNEIANNDVLNMLSGCDDTRAAVLINKAFTGIGLRIRATSATPLLPIFIYHFIGGDTESMSFPRIHIEAEGNAHLRVYERTISIGESAHFSSGLTTAHVARHSSVRLTKIQDFKKNNYTLDNVLVNQDEESHFYANTFSLSGGLIRNNLEIAINGEHAEANMYGLYLLDGHSHVDNHTVVDHRYPNCNSNEMYKGIVDEHATGVFNGKIFVRQPAQITNAFQANNNISLSEHATIHTKPQLEIWADDVKCSHGCTVGQLDEEALFYLRSRGIKTPAAKAMLLHAFAEEALRHVNLDIIKEEIEQLIHSRLDV